MRVAINQPAYLPWCGWIDRVKQSDLFILLDHVQLEKGGFSNRNRVKQPDGRVTWLTVPVEKGRPINRTRTMGENWARKHKAALAQCCGVDAPIEHRKWLLNACLQTQSWLLREAGISTRTARSSELGGERLGHKSELVLNLCKEAGATEYLSGPHGRDYLDIPAFEAAGVEVLYHDFPTGDTLSAVDFLFNPERTDSTWPQADLISAHSSLPLAEAA